MSKDLRKTHHWNLHPRQPSPVFWSISKDNMQLGREPAGGSDLKHRPYPVMVSLNTSNYHCLN